MRDLFNHLEELPAIVRDVILSYANHEDSDYTTCQNLFDEISIFGYTFDYGLDAIPHSLRKINFAL